MGSNKRAGSASKVRIDKFEDLFGGSAEQESSAEQIINAPLTDLHTFKDHPFRVEDDEKMEETTESIRQYGVLVPGIARPREGGGYEIIAGHRRKRGSELAGKKEMPVIVRNYTDALCGGSDDSGGERNLLCLESREKEENGGGQSGCA